MATARTAKNDDETQDSPFGEATTVPRVTRGRQPSAETLRIAELTMEAEKDRKARLIRGVNSKEAATNWKNKVASANRLLNKNRKPEDQITIRSVWDQEQGILYFASDTLLDELWGKAK